MIDIIIIKIETDIYDKGRSYDEKRNYNRNNQNFIGRNNVRDDRNRGKYNTG